VTPSTTVWCYSCILGFEGTVQGDARTTRDTAHNIIARITRDTADNKQLE